MSLLLCSKDLLVPAERSDKELVLERMRWLMKWGE